MVTSKEGNAKFCCKDSANPCIGEDCSFATFVVNAHDVY